MKKYIIFPINELLKEELTDMGLDLMDLNRGSQITNMHKFSGIEKEAILKIVNLRKSDIYNGVIKPAKAILQFLN